MSALITNERHEKRALVLWFDHEVSEDDRSAILAAINARHRAVSLEALISEALRLKGGWREAIVELEDHCGERVRLKNMMAAADQLDAWAAKARAAISKPTTATDEPK